MFIHYLNNEPETCFEKHARKCFRPDKLNYLRQKFPRSNYKSTSEWVKAVECELISISLPAIPGPKPAGLKAQVYDELQNAAREWKTEQKVAGSITHARELLEYEFKEAERLEARIVRQTRHCAELKAMEKMRSKT
jgi:hypothetical protein